MTKKTDKSARLVQTASGRNHRLIDLFCGCGGFSLGMERAGFRVLAAIDFNAEAIATFHRNLLHVPHALQKDLTKFRPQELAKLIGTDSVDVIVGGPPCQGFSTARQRDGANHGRERLVDDKRRHLYREFLRYVDYFRPKVFVMENVLGIRTAAGGEYFTRVQKESRLLGYRVHSQVEDAWELGVPQKRRRQLIIGVQGKLSGYFSPELSPSPRARPHTPLGAAIGDLPVLRAGDGEYECEYDMPRRTQNLRNHGKDARNYLFSVLEIEQASKLTNHVARPHSDRDLRDFARLREGENSATAMRKRGIKFEFPYDKSSFKDRYTRQSRQGACSTIVAHLSKDGLMFIHPTQNRSLTPREAARIQSFPDWFEFPTARTHAFRLIGNAVPPLIGEAVGLAIAEFLGARASSSTQRTANQHSASFIRPQADTSNIPNDSRDAVEWLLQISRHNRRQLRLLPKTDFMRGWHALLFLFPGIHPDSALDHGRDIEKVVVNHPQSPDFERLVANRFVRSGWPAALESIGAEAWRRYESGELAEEDFYCVAALRAGLMKNKVARSRPQRVDVV
jgi:DNA (cytosine-5)-methyltransferase 1